MSDKERSDISQLASIDAFLVYTVEGFIHNIGKWYTVSVLALKMVIFRRVNVNVIPTLVFEK